MFLIDARQQQISAEFELLAFPIIVVFSTTRAIGPIEDKWVMIAKLQDTKLLTWVTCPF